MRTIRLYAALAVLIVSAPVLGQQRSTASNLVVHVQATAHQFALSRPIDVFFSIHNTSDEAVTLTVPGTTPQIPPPEIGLPLNHVFSGGTSSGLSISSETGRRWELPISYHATTEAPILILGPRATVGTTINLRDYYPALRSAGRYQVTWRPYGGEVGSATATITVEPYKQVEITTDLGSVTVFFYYEDAPVHVANFLELATTGFYNGTTFHRVEPGYLIQGGCPRGDGTGIRLDGKRVSSEFNRHPHQKGSVSMALLEDDPESASCQFFICNTRQKEWDGRYTVFGQLVGEESFATLDRMMAISVDEMGRPLQPLYIRDVRAVNAPPDAYKSFP